LYTSQTLKKNQTLHLRMNIAVVGGGIIGLSLAYELLKKGEQVTLIEKNNIGGLLEPVKIGNTELEKYYHHFFLSDKEVFEYIKELNLKDKLIKKNTPMGFYVDNKLYNFSSPLSLLQFSPLSFIDRIKLGLSIVYFQKCSSKGLDKLTVGQWMKKHNLMQPYNVVWKPLLIAKFGKEHYNNIPCSWLWGRINQRSKSREFLKEKLCYLKGSYMTLIHSLEKSCKDKGLTIIKEEVTSLKENKDQISVKTKTQHTFDKVILTIPAPIIENIVPKNKQKEFSSNIEYKGVVCAIAVLKKSLSPYYWINVSDKRVKTSGIIEHTNFIEKEQYGKHLAYLFNYEDQSSTFLNSSDEKIRKQYKNDIKTVFPTYDQKNIEKIIVSKAKFATPLFDMDYQHKIPPTKTSIPNLFICNMTQIYPEDRNVAHSIRVAKKALPIILN